MNYLGPQTILEKKKEYIRIPSISNNRADGILFFIPLYFIIHRFTKGNEG